MINPVLGTGPPCPHARLLRAWSWERAEVPLKNRLGLSIVRNAVYDDLERLVRAGLADRVLLSMNPPLFHSP